ncbi:hypothetical protein HMI55_006347 [Coelomomyces lativittatus]|nr:hypothetical protein HMI55_006347 [Coelomomyces lativittatus]
MSDFTAFVSNIIDIDTQIYQYWLNGIGVHQVVLKQYSRHLEDVTVVPLQVSAPNLNESSSLPASDPSELKSSKKGSPPLFTSISPPPNATNSTSSLSYQSQATTSSSTNFSTNSTSTSSSSTSSSTSNLSSSSRILSTEKSFFPNVFFGVKRAMESVVDTWMTTHPSFSLSLPTPMSKGGTTTTSTPGASSTGQACTVVDPSLNLHVITQYRWFTCIEPLLHRPCSLEHAIVFKLAPMTLQALIDGYYSFDDILMREMVGKKLTARLRRDLDEGGVPTISVASARRQFDNLKRILKKTEETEFGRDGIETYFKLSPALASSFASCIPPSLHTHHWKEANDSNFPASHQTYFPIKTLK